MYKWFFGTPSVKKQINEPKSLIRPKTSIALKREEDKATLPIIKLWFSRKFRIFKKRFYKIGLNFYFQSLKFDFRVSVHNQGSETS